MNNSAESDRKKPTAYNDSANKVEQSDHLVKVMRKNSAKAAKKNSILCALKNSARTMEMEAKIGSADVWRSLKRTLSAEPEKSFLLTSERFYL